MPEPSDVVEPVRQNELYPPSSSHGGSSGGGGGGWKELAKIVILPALVFVYVFLTSGNYVTVAEETKNVQAITASITALSDKLKADETTIANVSGQLASLSKQVQDVQATYANINNTLASHTKQLDGLPTKADINAIQAQLATLGGTITSLPASIKTDYTAQITTLQGKLDTLSAQVAKLSTSENTTTTTGGTGTTSTGNIQVSIIGNPFTGSQTLTFSPISSSNTSAQQFTFQVANNTGKTINNIQFAVALELLDANNNIMTAGLPSGVSVGLTSSGTMTVWTQQSTGISYILGYTNSAPTGIFGGIGVINQSPGSVNYTLTVMVTTGVSGTPQFNILPIVKVVNYS